MTGTESPTAADLARWYAHAKKATDSIHATRYLLETGRDQMNGKTATDFLMAAQQETEALCQGLRVRGNVPTERREPLEVTLDLGTLASLDTPNAHALLDMLRQVQELAERVDAERGRAVGDDIPLLSGESRGTDYAESVSLLALKLDTELNGPMSARGRE